METIKIIQAIDSGYSDVFVRMAIRHYARQVVKSPESLNLQLPEGLKQRFHLISNEFLVLDERSVEREINQIDSQQQQEFLDKLVGNLAQEDETVDWAAIEEKAIRDEDL